MKNLASSLATIILLLPLPFFFWQCHQDDTPQPESVAGVYTGEYICTSYNGTSYPVSHDAGSLELDMDGDTLRLVNAGFCLYGTWDFQFDSICQAGKLYACSRWSVPNRTYSSLHYFVNFDSVIISLPIHSGYGWLGQEFRGKHQ